MLIKLLIQKDYPLRMEEKSSTFRNETLGLLLNFLSTNPDHFSDRTFVYDAYDKKGLVEGESNKSLMGWYYYQLANF